MWTVKEGAKSNVMNPFASLSTCRHFVCKEFYCRRRTIFEEQITSFDKVIFHMINARGLNTVACDVYIFRYCSSWQYEPNSLSTLSSRIWLIDFLEVNIRKQNIDSLRGNSWQGKRGKPTRFPLIFGQWNALSVSLSHSYPEAPDKNPELHHTNQQPHGGYLRII